jgi:hypothetical protein
MHPNTVITIPHEHPRPCPCGAVPEYPHGLCRKCHAGMVWRRRKTGQAQHSTRRRRGRQSRNRSRIMALAESMSRVSSKGADY